MLDEDNFKLTIFTPTFNRAKQLMRLYQSLCKQTNKRFQWLVIDDGSTDNTHELINSFIKDNIIRIRFITQPNGGKHVAYNRALDIVDKRNWHICVDSDDNLSKYAVEQFYCDINMVKEKKAIIGIVYPRNMSRNYEDIKKINDEINIPDIKFVYHLNLETAILFRPGIFQNLRFPVFDNETFLSEESIYIDLVSKGKFKFIPIYLYNAQYQEDGLTRSLFRLWLSNYSGTIFTLNKRYNYINNNLAGFNRTLEKIKVIINISAINIKCRKAYFSRCPNHMLATLLLPFTLLFSVIRFKK
ncbi:glycosyltransferase family 2 protein [Lapidilactobacillus dextrinicus]